MSESKPVRLEQHEVTGRVDGQTYEAHHYGPLGDRVGEWGTWYPDTDGLQAARGVAGELVEAVLEFEFCPCCLTSCNASGNDLEHQADCALGALLAKARRSPGGRARGFVRK